jgi:hypothetical protein
LYFPGHEQSDRARILMQEFLFLADGVDQSLTVGPYLLKRKVRQLWLIELIFLFG